jgi:hypothetical protein
LELLRESAALRDGVRWELGALRRTGGQLNLLLAAAYAGWKTWRLLARRRER